MAPNNLVPPGNSFPKAARLRRRREFLAVQRNAKSKFHSKHFFVLLTPTARPLPHGRVGITVTKKVGTAVKRNRIKRLVREFVRLQGAAWLPAARDVVIVAKRSAATIRGLDEITADLAPLGRRLSRC